MSPCHGRGAMVWLAAASLALAGCATVTKRADRSASPAVSWKGAELYEAVSQRQKHFRSLRVLARVAYSGPDGKHGFQEAIHVQRPDLLRLETLSMLGAVLIVTVNDKEIIGYHPRDGIFVRGARTKENLLRYTQIPLELEEMTQLLLGLPPVDAKSSWSQDGNSLLFSVNGRKIDVVAFEAEQAVPTRWQRFDATGAVEISATFNDYKSTPQGMFPLSIRLEAPPQGRKLELRYDEPEINTALSAELFTQQKPVHAQEVPIEAIASP